MEGMELLERMTRLFDSNVGRDKAVRTTQFSLLLFANGLRDRRRADQLAALAKQCSRTRLISRIFSQPQLLLSALRIPRELRASADPVDTACGSSTTVLYLLCGWVELLGWLTEAGLLRSRTFGQAADWFQRSLRLWIVALTINVVRNIRLILLRLPSPSPSKWTKQQRRWLHNQLISLAGISADLVGAVNSLPAGTLWGGRLSGTQSAGLFLVASLVGVYKLL